MSDNEYPTDFDGRPIGEFRTVRLDSENQKKRDAKRRRGLPTSDIVAAKRENAIPAPIDYEDAGIAFPAPRVGSVLRRSEKRKWLWHGYLAPGYCTLFNGLWKAGKTTLLSYLLRDFAEGGDLGGTISPAKVLVVSEENEDLWAQRIDEMRIGDHVSYICRPFYTKLNLKQWEGFIRFLTGHVVSDGFDVVLFDTLPAFWSVNEENDASKVGEALVPLNRMLEAGAAILLIHHLRKGDGTEGQGSRGSGALPAFADIIIEFRRYRPKVQEDRRRTLTGYSRFKETPGETILELAEDGYTTVGSASTASRQERWGAIADLLLAAPSGLTLEGVLHTWPTDGIPTPGTRTIQSDLREGVKTNLWVTGGTGRKGDPYRYILENAIPASIQSYRCANSIRGQKRTLDNGQHTRYVSARGRRRPPKTTPPTTPGNGPSETPGNPQKPLPNNPKKRKKNKKSSELC